MNETLEEMVSVVIPSRNRPHLASRAVRSALGQTLKSIEVIVVVDGPDRATVKELKQIEDPRLKVIALPVNVGASAARNAGVGAAKGAWIAFLDDDDEWLPQKLDRQLELATHSCHAFPVVASCLIARNPKGEFVWPRRLPAPSEPLSEYLFARNSLFVGEGFIQTSTFFTKKELLKKLPFQKNLPRHEDWDWLLRVSALEGVGLEFVPEPVAIWNTELGRKSLSNINDWQYSLDWIRSVRNLVTRRAYSGFIVTVVSPQASLQRDWKVFWPLLREAVRFGQLRPTDYLLYLAMWLLPQDVRQQIRGFFWDFKRQNPPRNRKKKIPVMQS
ncbi:glycosyltransferase family 2 protein [Kamptonema formosum]|uniref:glycosyltransferase family 2 protein n=1 Tax=Kamptonema formosum TaxID=331992 RepID=UPI000348EC23|nr:glycosyltransferase family 2 protein [Oscillatoria sp. PCC 10802]